LILELDVNNDIDFISEFIGTELIHRKCVAEFVE